LRVLSLLCALFLFAVGCDDIGGSTSKEICDNQIDDDGDGLTDCDDPQCAGMCAANNVNNTGNTNNVNNTSSTAGDWHEEAAYQGAEERGTVSWPALTETSGIAFSRVNPGLIWLHNDSGDGPYVYAVTTDGSYLGRLDLDGVWAEDWEDIAVGTFQGAPAIFVGDFGDNPETRTDYQIHVIPEPEVDVEHGFGELAVDSFTTWEFTYGAAGPRNCEAMMVDPAGEIYLVEKALGTSASLWHLSPSAPQEAIYVGEIALGSSELVTAADLCEHGRNLVLATYSGLILYILPEDSDPSAAVDAEVNTVFEANLYQLEAVAFEPGTEDIWLISEGGNPRLYEFPHASD